VSPTAGEVCIGDLANSCERHNVIIDSRGARGIHLSQDSLVGGKVQAVLVMPSPSGFCDCAQNDRRLWWVGRVE
jgi:hypothetical protein